MRFSSVNATAKPQINLLLFGAPGVGKGTYGKLIQKDFDFPTFSMGEYFRALINDPNLDQNDKFLQSVKSILRSGKLIDDHTVIEVIKNIKASNKYEGHRGVIFDGVPRTIKQAEMMRQILKIDLVVNFYIKKEEILVEKLMARRVCPSCQKNYNVAEIHTADGYEMKALLPKKDPTKCDGCNIPLVIRDDDKESIIRDRLEVYKN